jgi:hypothetical protein
MPSRNPRRSVPVPGYVRDVGNSLPMPPEILPWQIWSRTRELDYLRTVYYDPWSLGAGAASMPSTAISRETQAALDEVETLLMNVSLEAANRAVEVDSDDEIAFATGRTPVPSSSEAGNGAAGVETESWAARIANPVIISHQTDGEDRHQEGMRAARRRRHREELDAADDVDRSRAEVRRFESFMNRVMEKAMECKHDEHFFGSIDVNGKEWELVRALWFLAGKVEEGKRGSRWGFLADTTPGTTPSEDLLDCSRIAGADRSGNTRSRTERADNLEQRRRRELRSTSGIVREDNPERRRRRADDLGGSTRAHTSRRAISRDVERQTTSRRDPATVRASGISGNDRHERRRSRSREPRRSHHVITSPIYTRTSSRETDTRRRDHCASRRERHTAGEIVAEAAGSRRGITPSSTLRRLPPLKLADRSSMTVEAQLAEALAAVVAQEDELKILRRKGADLDARLAQEGQNNELAELRQRSEERKCPICYDAEKDCLFLACYHLGCCYECAKKLEKPECPICRCPAWQDTVARIINS